MAIRESSSLAPALFASVFHVLIFIRWGWKRRERFECWQWKSSDAQDSAQAQMLKRLSMIEVDQRLQQRAGWLADISGLMFMFHGFLLLDDYDGWFTKEQRYCMTAGSFLVLAMRLCASNMNIRLLPAWFALIVLATSSVVYFSNYSNRFAVLRSMGTTVIGRAVYSIVFCQIKSAAFWNLVASVMNVFVFAQLEGKPTDIGTVHDFAIWELLLTATIIVVTWHTRRSVERECEHLVGFRSLSVESSALTKLLGLVCDVVVELDANLVITEDAARLSAMLNIARGTKHVPLIRYMPQESDRDSFKNMLSSTSPSLSGKCSPGALHSTLRDSLNNNISVELFFVPFQNADSSRGFFVGIREVSEQPIAELPSHSDLRRKKCCSREEESAFVRQMRGQVRESNIDDVDVFAVGESAAGDSDDEILSCHSSIGSDEAMSAFGRQQPRRLSGCLYETSTLAKTIAIVATTLHWNTALSPDSCCKLHTLLQEVRHISTMLLRKLPCNALELPPSNRQCDACGWIVETKSLDVDTSCPCSSMTRADMLASSSVAHSPSKASQSCGSLERCGAAPPIVADEAVARAALICETLMQRRHRASGDSSHGSTNSMDARLTRGTASGVVESKSRGILWPSAEVKSNRTRTSEQVSNIWPSNSQRSIEVREIVNMVTL